MSEEQAANTVQEVVSADVLREPGTGRFVKGVSPNPYGRKGNPNKRNMIEELRKRADRNAVALAQAAIDGAKRGNVRALTFVRDTVYGVPAQKLVVEREDDPLGALLQAMAQARGLVVEGEVVSTTPIASDSVGE